MAEDEIPELTAPRVEAGEITETLVRVTHLAAIDPASIPRILGKAQADSGVVGIISLEAPGEDDMIQELGRRMSVDLTVPVGGDGRRPYVQCMYDERITAPEGYSIRDISATRDEAGRAVCYVLYEPEY